MLIRICLFWLLSATTLVLCLFLPISLKNGDETHAINLLSYLDVKPGQFFRSEGRLHAEVVNQLKLNIKLEPLQDQLLKFDTIQFEGLEIDHQTTINMVWKIGDETQQIKINSNPNSINVFNFNTDQVNEITDLHLLITTNHELGTVIDINHEVSFKTIQLGRTSDISGAAQNWSEWTDFTPVSISSINGFTKPKDLQLKQLMMNLSIWLVGIAWFYWLIKINGRHLLAVVFLAWLIPACFYLANHAQQHQRLSTVYADGQTYINAFDQEVADLAKKIDQVIRTENHISAGDKIVLVGLNDFFSLRLLHHLIDFNLAIDSNLRELVEQHRQSNLTLLLTQRNAIKCQRVERYDWLTGKVQILHQDKSFCLMRIL